MIGGKRRELSNNQELWFCIHMLYIVLLLCIFFLSTTKTFTDPDQAMSEHLDKELLWNIQLLSQVHQNCPESQCFLISAHVLSQVLLALLGIKLCVLNNVYCTVLCKHDCWSNHGNCRKHGLCCSRYLHTHCRSFLSRMTRWSPTSKTVSFASNDAPS